MLTQTAPTTSGRTPPAPARTIRPFIRAGRRSTRRWADWALAGRQETRDLVAATEASYVELCRTVAWPRHPVLRAHLAVSLLPGLALYRSLQAAGWSRSEATDAVATALEQAMLPRRRRLERLAAHRGFFPLLALMIRVGSPVLYPAAGWGIQWLEVSRRRVAFDIDRCYYVATLADLGAPELTPLYCRGDDLLYANLSPELEWRRTSTIGMGCEVCDFRYLRHPAQPGVPRTRPH